MTTLSRRGFLTRSLALPVLAAPAIVSASSLMRIRPIHPLPAYQFIGVTTGRMSCDSTWAMCTRTDAIWQAERERWRQVYEERVLKIIREARDNDLFIGQLHLRRTVVGTYEPV
jgi:hypothetical protein